MKTLDVHALDKGIDGTKKIYKLAMNKLKQYKKL
ncbi:hypothetical protein DFR56_102222 [Pseudogracilibacillus auburnensis]|uniref:Uncharacterized protein n=1 Tax=Pseudogracilibacillus auburnensis TaxID=1494959 RepID=A0A2V3WBB1_9BACI|nr:hypothetical protein DFR56_102222 [Pseudogracilibacillus auburnensis]